jgi:RNA polymerase sigma-70 factor (ECF subfamily)
MHQEPRDRDGVGARVAVRASTAVAAPADDRMHADRAHADDRRAWPDARLIVAVRDEPPDAAALDVLVARHWKGLHARCMLLTLSRDLASDLAQETWLRLLRARHTLDPDGNLPAYLATIATNLWRDRGRAARRAGPLAEHRLASLDAPPAAGDANDAELADALPDPGTLSTEVRTALRIDLDRALGRLAPRSREVLIARYVDGESAAEIGARHGRTEQTITAWLRQAAREIRQYLDAPAADDAAAG